MYLWNSLSEKILSGSINHLYSRFPFSFHCLKLSFLFNNLCCLMCNSQVKWDKRYHIIQLLSRLIVLKICSISNAITAFYIIVKNSRITGWNYFLLPHYYLVCQNDSEMDKQCYLFELWNVFAKSMNILILLHCTKFHTWLCFSRSPKEADELAASYDFQYSGTYKWQPPKPAL